LPQCKNSKKEKENISLIIELTIFLSRNKTLKILGQISTWILERRGAVLVLAFKVFG
jgi:hypothetical protein